MKALVYFVTIIFFLSGCGLLNSKNDKKDPLYDWEEIARFKSEWITAIATNGENELYVAQSNKLSYSDDAAETFKSFTAPDSADITKIKIHDRLYIIGDVYRSGGGFWGSIVSYVYASDDNGRNWEEIVGGFLMQDIIISENMLHIGKKHGVISYDLEGDSIYSSNLFLYSKLSDHMEELTASEDGTVYVSSHGGIFASYDRGKNWEKISSSISKNYDHIKSLAVDDENDVIYAAEYRRLYYRKKDEVIWAKIKVNSGTEKVRLLSNNTIITADWNQVNLANKLDLDFRNIGPEYEETETDILSLEFLEIFTDNKIVVAGYDHIFIGSPIKD